MEHSKEKNAWMSVPQFGGWEQKMGGNTDYSVVFSRARANRKHAKSDIHRSIGTEEELIQKVRHDDDSASVQRKKKIFSYLCCVSF